MVVVQMQNAEIDVLRRLTQKARHWDKRLRNGVENQGHRKKSKCKRFVASGSRMTLQCTTRNILLRNEGVGRGESVHRQTQLYRITDLFRRTVRRF